MPLNLNNGADFRWFLATTHWSRLPKLSVLRTLRKSIFYAGQQIPKQLNRKAKMKFKSRQGSNNNNIRFISGYAPFCIMAGVKEREPQGKVVVPRDHMLWVRWRGLCHFICAFILLDFIHVALAISRMRLIEFCQWSAYWPDYRASLPLTLAQSHFFPADLETCSNTRAHTLLVLGSNGRQPLQVTHFRDAATPTNCSYCKRQARRERTRKVIAALN